MDRRPPWPTTTRRSGSTTNSFTYNGLNARMTRTDSNGSRTMLRDGADVLAPVIKDGSKEYAPGLYQWDSSNGSKPFVTDRLGSVTKITDWQGNSPASKSFDAFGVQQSGGTSDLFGFAGAWGYQSDADHGLQLLGHRVYDPDLGRFLTRDPIKDGRNWYGYCENNPSKFVDPSGEAPEWIERIKSGAREFWDNTGKIIRPGKWVIGIAPYTLALGMTIGNAQEEANQFREYKKMVEMSGLAGDQQQEMIRKNRPGMGGVLGILKAAWELLIEAF